MHQTWFEDLRPWVDQLHEDHGLLTHICVSCPPAASGLNWAVIVELVRAAGATPGIVGYRDWAVFNPRDTGAAEAAALLMLSRALLSLDNQKAEIEREQASLWDAVS